MAYNAKTTKPRMYSTYIDVILRAKAIKTDKIDFSDSDVVNVIESVGGIELWIMEADSIINTYLKPLYSDSILRTTPWSSPVIKGLGAQLNTGTGNLNSISLNSTTAYTAGWKINITSNSGDYWLLYDTETVAFTVGKTLTGTTSLATGIIEQVIDNGTEGALLLTSVTGIFQDNEKITDDGDLTGTAAANGTLGNAILYFDTETSNFTVSETLTGTTSLATGTIVGLQDDGTSGIIALSGVVTAFQNNETITDSATGSALANGNSIHANKASSFTVESSLEGNQGSGNQYTDFTSTNNDITIYSEAWSGLTDTNDTFYFSVIDSNQIIWMLSSKLAAASLLESIYQKSDPTEVGYHILLRKSVEKLLDKLSRPFSKDGLKLDTSINLNAESIWIDYNISEYGTDESSYLTTTNY